MFDMLELIKYILVW